MTVQQCKYVIEIAKRGSFNEAAKHLFVSQSGLSNSVKALEDELGIVIFERSSNGVFLTEDGAEFIRFCTQLTEQHDFILQRYENNTNRKKLYVSTQHYDFVADVFGRMIRETSNDEYQFSLRETHTYRVIHEIETGYSDIGILAIKDSDETVMKRYLKGKGVEFKPFLKTYAHIFLSKTHPLAKEKIINLEMLKDYPYVSYEQGDHNSTFFAEEIFAPSCNKHIEISDRATLMNVLLSTECYTVGTGIMPSLLNGGNIVSIPLECNDFYIIGYILMKDRGVSELTNKFIELLKNETYKWKQ